MACGKLYLLNVCDLSLGVTVIWGAIKVTNIHHLPTFPPIPFIITIATTIVVVALRQEYLTRVSHLSRV